MQNPIYILFSCNAWKEYSSMDIVFVGDSLEALKTQIENEIINDNMYYESEELSSEEQLALFDEEADFNKLIYGFVDTFENNELDL